MSFSAKAVEVSVHVLLLGESFSENTVDAGKKEQYSPPPLTHTQSRRLSFYTKQSHTKFISPKCTLGKLESKYLPQKAQSLDIACYYKNYLLLYSPWRPSETLRSLVPPIPPGFLH